MYETIFVLAVIAIVIGVVWALVVKYRERYSVLDIKYAAAKLREVFKSDKK
jgi:hypothetical protein